MIDDGDFLAQLFGLIHLVGRNQDRNPGCMELAQAMVDQFIAYSTGNMREEDDKALRAELGAWPERYWQALPAVVYFLKASSLRAVHEYKIIHF